MKKILASLQQNLEISQNGIEALKMTNLKTFDVIFMDLNMPLKDGIQTSKELRSLGCMSWIIALTANALWDSRVRCIDAGMNDFLAKPARVCDIRDAIQRFIEQL